MTPVMRAVWKAAAVYALVIVAALLAAHFLVRYY